MKILSNLFLFKLVLGLERPKRPNQDILDKDHKFQRENFNLDQS